MRPVLGVAAHSGKRSVSECYCPTGIDLGIIDPMSPEKGKIVLMGSGELTPTMVEVHKALISGLAPPKRAVFLDTPAGFQLNVDQISETAIEYFLKRIQHRLSVASFKSAEGMSHFGAEKAFDTLRNANFILIGPGSPTYAVRHIKQSPIPDIFLRVIRAGGCLVAASAAALTVGAYTLPVYEIYKVGEDIHWIEGINILAHFDLDLVVVPHWNNAEGGTHDTRRCFIGEPRFRKLAELLPQDLGILGLDEHTACIIDLNTQQVTIKGIGRVIVIRGDKQQVYKKGDVFPLGVLQGKSIDSRKSRPARSGAAAEPEPTTFWSKIHAIEGAFKSGVEARNPGMVTNSLLELDRAIWQGKQDLEDDGTIAEVRELFRDHIVVLGDTLTDSPGDARDYLAPLVDNLLEMREKFRKNKQFAEADALRGILQQARIHVEDTPDGVRWRLQRP